MKILAGVVTYNRLVLLKDCITSLRAQTYRGFDILVVDNGSTDGTREYLDTDSSLIVVHQENRGGAGGFYACQKYAVEHGYDYVWLMDDDGIAAPNQLELLIDGVRKYHLDLANAFVINKDDHSITSDGLNVETFKQEHPSGYWELANAFNGTLINCEALKKVGYVKKEMYIWGDEQEFLWRFATKGCSLGTVIAAEHYHPPFKTNREYVIPFVKRGPQIGIKHSTLNKYQYRNFGYLDKIHGKAKKSKRFMLDYVLYYLLRGNIVGAIKFVRYYNLGWNEDYQTKI